MRLLGLTKSIPPVYKRSFIPDFVSLNAVHNVPLNPLWACDTNVCIRLETNILLIQVPEKRRQAGVEPLLGRDERAQRQRSIV